MDAQQVSLRDIVEWAGYLLYLLGFILLWIYTRDHKELTARVSGLEATRPTRTDVETMISAAFYEDSKR